MASSFAASAPLEARWRRLGRLVPQHLSGLACACLIGLHAAAAHAEDPSRVEWSPDWQRYRSGEAFATGLLAFQIAAAGLLYSQPERNWRGGVLFDDAVRDALRLNTKDAREQARSVSDKVYLYLGVFPLIVDNLIVTWAIHGSGDVALEMLGMNLESYALTGAIVLTAQKVGRERPAARGCVDDPEYSPKCHSEVGLTESFFSGHTAVDFTAAGLICAHHQHLPLYGGGVPDVAICIAGLTAATAQGALRIMTDDHYSTDVLVGVGVGVFSGYVLPHLLHYGFGGEGERGRGWLPTFTSNAAGMPLEAVLAPAIDAHYLGLNLVGIY